MIAGVLALSFGRTIGVAAQSLSVWGSSTVPATGRFRRQIGTESYLLPIQPAPSFPYLPSALAFIKITTNFALNAGVLSLIISVGEALNLNVRAILDASVLGLIIGVSKALNFNVGALLKASDSPLKASESGISSLRALSFPSSSLLKVGGSLLKITLSYIRYLLRLL